MPHGETRGMTALDAGLKVLEAAAIQLHSEGITLRMIEGELWTTRGQMPDQTVGYRLRADIRYNRSRFQRVSDGMFALRAWRHPEYEETFSVDDQQGELGVPAARTGTLKYVDAAEYVLERLGRPAHYEDITDIALSAGLVETNSEAPAATFTTKIAAEVFWHDGCLRRRACLIDSSCTCLDVQCHP